MSHYRQMALNNRLRLLVAVVLAAALHAGLMNCEFAAPDFSGPQVSLPRVVSLVLRPGKTAEPVHEAEQTEPVQPRPAKMRTAEAVSAAKPVNKRSAVNDAVKITKQPPDISAATAKKKAGPAAVQEKPAVNGHASIAAGRESPAEAETTPERAATSVSAPDAGKAVAPGAVQLAYPRYRDNKPPAYPGRARKKGQEGTVILRVLVDPEGRVAELEIERSSGVALLDRTAAAAVKKWLFEPGRRDAVKVRMWVRVPVTFRLRQ